VRTSEPPKVGHDTLFEVFRHGSGRVFAMGNQGDDVVVIDGVEGGVAAVRMTLPSAVKALGKRVRGGYVRSSGRMFFNERSGRFTLIHPDVDWKGLKWLLAATPASIAEGSRIIADIVRTMPATAITPEEIEQWVQRQEKNVKHVVAFNDHAAWPLALAQAALNHGWGLRASSEIGAVPDAPPSVAPSLWAQWLSTSFKSRDVQDAQANLGWTTEAFITSDRTAPGGANNLSALI
jgi:hypothetical protein